MDSNQIPPPVSMSSPPAAGCHRLPQIPTMGRNVRTAQSKSSAKLSFESKPRDESAVLHIEGTSKVIKILTDGISELTEFESKENTLSSAKKSTESDIVEKLNTPINNDGVNDIAKKKRKRKNDNSANGSKRISNANSNGPTLDSGCLQSDNLDQSDNLEAAHDKDSNIKTNPGNSSLDDVEMLPQDHPTPQFEQSASESSSCLFESLNEKADKKKKESPLEKKKRTSKMGIADKIVKSENNDNPLSPSEEESSSLSPSKSLIANNLTEPTEVEALPAAHIPRCVLITPSEVPSEAQLEKLLAMESAAFDLNHPPQWEEGDILWAKVSGHPYWPCMVSRCPFTKMFTRIKGDVRIVRSYHVQFFGNEVERGWINEPSLMLFEGKLSFLEKAQIETSKQPKRGKSAYNPFKINISRRHAWNIAVEEAEGAMPLSKADRKVQYTFEYVFMDDLKKEQQKLKGEQLDSSPNALPGTKRKRDPSEGNVLSPAQEKRKRRKLDTSMSSVTPHVAETSFDSYYANHRSTVIEKHPEWDTTFVFEFLRQQWENEKKKASTPKPRRSQTTPESASATSRSGSTPKSQGSTKRGRPPSKLIKLLTGNSPQVPLEQEAKEQGSSSQPKRKGRPPKIPVLPQVHDTEAVSTLVSNLMEATGDISALEEDTARPKTAASALSARKASQESDSSTEGKGKGLRENEPYELEIFKLNSNCKIDKDKVCSICEKNGETIECTGSCGQFFHTSCVNIEAEAAEQYLCPECTSGVHACFSCKKADLDTVKCSVNACGKYYHEDCVKKYRLTRIDSKGFVCPLHTCVTCSVDSVKNPKAGKGRFYRCVRCPTAYHVGDFCIAAGSVHLAGFHIVCSDHFQPNRSMSCHSRLNITWCFSCSKGGTLLCCETCPAAFHAECVKVDKTPEEAWFCTDCAEGRKPLYGNIVWIKVGNYRWWPGEICHPRHVPLNIQEKAHQVGEFPVRFFGSHDYYWIHRGRVFLFQEGDKGSREGSSRGLFKIYMKGIKEATEAYNLWMAAKAKKMEQEQERSDKKPAPFKFVKSNVPIGSVQICKAELSEIPRCECKPDQEDACTSDCLNRMMMYECHPSACPAGEKCHNQRFQKRQYPEVEPFKCENRGWGLRCLQDIKKGQFVQEYVGDLIDEEECKRRIEQAHDDNITNFYMLTMDKNRIIDAGPKGNYSRFMNHSCCPNLETQKWMVNGDIRVGLFALRDIAKGSELTFNYNLECLGNEKKACACGAENCSGFLGVRPKTAAAAANEKKAKEPKKKRRKKKLDPRKEHEDDCFRCGEGGELVMCDKGNCRKVYHLQCLKLTKPPSGKWLCPWHHCDECGKLAAIKCSECPNSYCSNHTEGNIFKVEEAMVCLEHTDLLEGISQSVSSIPEEDGSIGIKSETAINAVENDTVGSTCVPGVKVEADGNQPLSDTNVASNSSDLKQRMLESNIKAENGGNSKPRMKHKNGKSAAAVVEMKQGVTNVNSSSTFATPPLEISTDSANGIKNVAGGHGSPSFSTGTAANFLSGSSFGSEKLKKSRPRNKINTVCRTKARYRARLTSASAASALNTPSPISKPVVPNQASSPATKSAVHESDDNDSISDLVIDIP